MMTSGVILVVSHIEEVDPDDEYVETCEDELDPDGLASYGMLSNYNCAAVIASSSGKSSDD